MIASTTIDGIPVELLIIPPDWSDSVSLEIGIAVDSRSGQSGKESRRPESLHPRFKMTFTPDFTAADSEDIVTMKATIGQKRVAVPVFPDTQSAITDDFIFSGQHYVSWNDAGTLYAVDADTYSNVAPLLFGYIENNQYEAKTETVGRTSLTVVEDSPFSHRLSINVVGTNETFGLVPDWTSTITEKLVSPIDRTEIGRSRERKVENTEAAFYYEQDARFTLISQTDLSYFLSFWYQRKGRLFPFTVPTFFQPASATAETPDAYFARFRGEKIQLIFRTPNVASIGVGFIQMPWELNDSGVEKVTDKLFEDPDFWTGFADGNISVVTGISGMPERCARIVPAAGSSKQLQTASIDASATDRVVFSALLSEDGSLSNSMRLEIVAFDSGHSVLGSNNVTVASPTTTPTIATVEYDLPSSTDHFEVNMVVITDGTTGGNGYFGNPTVTLWKASALTLEEIPVQAATAYAFDFAFDVPGKSNIRLIDWERSTTIGGNAFSPYKMTLDALKKGTGLFNEEATISYVHESDNPLIEFVEGGLERLVTLTIKEGDPMNPAGFRNIFVGKLRGFKATGINLRAAFTALGGIFDRKIPGFVIQSKCNYLLGDANCGVNLASLEAYGSADSGDLTEGDMKITVASMTGTLTTVNDPDGNPGDRFAGGYLVIGTSSNYQIRYVKKTTNNGGTSRTFTVNRPIDATKLDASDGVVHVFPGCGGAAWECSGFWSNYANFGGHPFVPEQLDAVQGETPKVGK